MILSHRVKRFSLGERMLQAVASLRFLRNLFYTWICWIKESQTLTSTVQNLEGRKNLAERGIKVYVSLYFCRLDRSQTVFVPHSQADWTSVGLIQAYGLFLLLIFRISPHI